jgi:predicted nucleic acid-binding protein
MKSIFLDTNVYLHYELFDQIDWLEIVDAEPLTIVVPPVTIRELNKHKDYHTQRRVKKRAGEVLKRLCTLFDSNSVAYLRGRVAIRLEDRDSSIDFAARQLLFEIQDDQLIASIIMHRNEAPEGEVVLVTSDAGLTLLAKARRHGISTAKMPDNLRVAEQPDPSQKRVKQLEQEVRELTARIPRLSLTFEDGNQHATFTLPIPLELPPDKFERKLNEIKHRYPKTGRRTEPSSEPRQSMRSQEPSELMAAMHPMILASQKEITRYNAELEEFYQAYGDYLKNSIQFKNFKHRAIELVILLANDGTAPAEDIDIFLHFPDGFRVLEGEDLPRSPKAPKPPVEPRTPMQMLTESLPPMVEVVPYLGSHDSGPIAPPPNVSAPNIKRTNSYEVSFHVQKAKHNLQEPFKPMYVAFDSFEEASSFHIDYQILAANIPHEINGEVHIVIRREGSKP